VRGLPSLSAVLSAHSATGAGRAGGMKTLKREEIYANKYDDLENLRANIEEFIEQ
jgi:hypothetical protein